jgi:lysophospholipase L1-like esterase
VDGAVTRDVERQLARLPADATLLVISVGGNDALGESYLLRQPARTIGEGMMVLANAQRQFADRYQAMLEAVLGARLPVVLCTIYDGNFPGAEGQVIAAALSLFNDVITRAAFSRDLPLIDLRLICSEETDYANSIEPSEQGGAKIAAAIARLALGSTASGSLVAAR